jgi:hypothetical protein
MIPLEPLLCLAGTMPRLWQHHLQGWRVDGGVVRRGGVGTHLSVLCAEIVDRPKDIAGHPSDLHVRLVDAPRAAHAVPVATCRLLIERSEVLDPIKDGRGIHIDSTLSQ